MNIKTQFRPFTFLALLLALLLIFTMSISYTFAQDDAGTTNDTETGNAEGGTDNPFRDTLREQRDVRRDLLSDQQETVRVLREEQVGRVESLRDSGATIDEVRALRSDQIDESRTLRDGQRDERQDIRDTQRGDRRAALDERRQARIEAYSQRILKRMNAAIDRLYKIAGRVESRILKLEEKHDGLDLSGAKDLLAAARTALDTAQSDVDAGDAAIQDTLSSDTPKDAFNVVRELFQAAKQSIKDAHKALVDAIIATKAGTGEHGEGGDHVHEDDADGDTDGGESEEENEEGGE